MAVKNFLMISIDDMRTVSNWAHFTPLIRTPHMDRLADMGTTFERAVTQVPLCNPARTSVLSGLPPSETGVLDNQMPWYERVNPADTLPAVLKAAGAYVAMFGKHFHTEAPLDAAQQAVMFDEFIPGTSTDGTASQVIQDGLRHDHPFATGRYRTSDLQDERTADAAVECLRQRAGDLDEPFFLGVGISKPHPNWWVPSAYFDLYDPAAIRAALRKSLQ
ncbi:MAG TPA: sulfatase-like hydrolase/transferase, partial [Amaricoccus sp.]|nr:sulfatase-like hydrolase/transferase [Amaricoccus sp.]